MTNANTALGKFYSPDATTKKLKNHLIMTNKGFVQVQADGSHKPWKRNG